MPMSGVVKKYIEERGFGFITPDAGGDDIFVHVKALKSGTLTQGCRVEYELSKDPEGRKRASKVTVLANE